MFFILSNFEFYLVNALLYVDIDQGIHKVKFKVTQKEKEKFASILFFLKSVYLPTKAYVGTYIVLALIMMLCIFNA